MIKRNKNTYRNGIAFFALCVLFIAAYILIASAMFGGDRSALGQMAGNVNLIQRFDVEGDIMPLAVSDNALELTNEYIDSVSLSYKENGEWVEISESSGPLPADASYQLKIEYDHITASDLLGRDCQMIYGVLPGWFSPNESGVLLNGEEVVADIECKNGMVVVTFREDWLIAQGDNNLHGTFKINGEIEWSKLPSEGGPVEVMPGLNVGLTFEDDLASKYGIIEVEKSEPELVYIKDGDADAFYLKYDLIVASLEDVEMPDVYLSDLFTSNFGYIEGYVGITEDMDKPERFKPKESSTEDPYEEGKLEIDGRSMKWTIGTLKPNETRTLTYYAKISQDYVDSVLSTQFRNNAEVFSKGILKASDTSAFSPQTTIDLKKELSDLDVDSTGTGTLTYEITISAPEDNSYTLKGLRLSDSFPEELLRFLKVDSIIVDGVEQDIDGDGQGSNGFPISYDFDLAPGSTIKITYTVKAEYIFAAGNEDIELTNTASVSSSDGRTLRETANNKTLRQNNWMRKVYGDPIEEQKTIDIASEDAVYDSNKQPVANAGDMSFIVPKGSLRYQVVLNEDGRWDLSNASLKDSFGEENNYMHYQGYVQISIYDPIVDPDKIAPEDVDLLAALEEKTPVKTVWLNVDDLTNFDFTPKNLGFDNDKNYTYLLTYYAKPFGIENVSVFEASNSFEIMGEIGYGYGDGRGTIKIPGMRFTVSNVMEGGANYKVTKTGWYYEPSPVQNVAVASDYPDGAVYWVIRLDGEKIPEGGCTFHNNNNTPPSNQTGFIIGDNPSGCEFARDSVAGVYEGSDSFDFSQFSSFEQFETEMVSSGEFYELKGNSLNEKYFQTTDRKTVEYIWGGSPTTLEGLFFPNGYTIKENNALYIIVRNKANGAPNYAYTRYTNDVTVKEPDSSVFVRADNAEYIVTNAIYKESKGAYTYDAETGKTQKCDTSYNNNRDGWNESSLDWTYIKNNHGSGTYIPWLLNVNYNGTMEGIADVTDILPKGMELAYCDILWIGNTVSNNAPECEPITELDNDGDWIRLEKENRIEYKALGRTINVNAITYYNPSTGELRWRINNLTKAANAPVAGGYEMNLRIICKLTDQDAFLSRGEKTFENYAYTGEESTTATVTIARNGVMDKKVIGVDLDNGVYTNEQNRLPFSIEINPLGEDLCEGDKLPALIDELSRGLTLVEDSLTVIDAKGNEIKGYSYTTNEDNDGKQIIKITGLPDGVKFTIHYETRISAKPGESISGLSNNAYWAGYPFDSPQVDHASFRYNIGGVVFSNEPFSATIIKVDSADHTKKLEGAQFEIYEVNPDGTLKEQYIASATTDSNGKLTVDVGLICNRVYCIKETASPNGYKLEGKPHYFVVCGTNFDLAEQYPGVTEEVEFWYESLEYSYVMPNDKGTISVEKIFVGENGLPYEQTSGSYSFGLFASSSAKVPDEILTIEYSEGSVKYYLDGHETGEPCFSKYDPELSYYVYELDSSGAPIKNDETSEINGISYHVRYFDNNFEQKNLVTVNSKITIMNSVSITEEVSFKAPSTGGSGTEKIYLAGSSLISASLLLYMLLKYSESRKKRRNA